MKNVSDEKIEIIVAKIFKWFILIATWYVLYKVFYMFEPTDKFIPIHMFWAAVVLFGWCKFCRFISFIMNGDLNAQHKNN